MEPAKHILDELRQPSREPRERIRAFAAFQEFATQPWNRPSWSAARLPGYPVTAEPAARLATGTCLPLRQCTVVQATEVGPCERAGDRCRQ